MKNLCGCSPDLHAPRCRVRAILAARARLYEGQYEGRTAATRFAAAHRLLNPEYAADDLVGLRFALLEVA